MTKTQKVQRVQQILERTTPHPAFSPEQNWAMFTAMVEMEANGEMTITWDEDKQEYIYALTKKGHRNANYMNN